MRFANGSNVQMSPIHPVDNHQKNDYDPKPFRIWGKILGVFIIFGFLFSIIGLAILPIAISYNNSPAALDYSGGKPTNLALIISALLMAIGIILSISIMTSAGAVFIRESYKLSGAPQLFKQAILFIISGVLALIIIGNIMGIFVLAYFAEKKRRPIELCKRFGIEKFFFEVEYHLAGRCDHRV